MRLGRAATLGGVAYCSYQLGLSEGSSNLLTQPRDGGGSSTGGARSSSKSGGSSSSKSVGSKSSSSKAARLAEATERRLVGVLSPGLESVSIRRDPAAPQRCLQLT